MSAESVLQWSKETYEASVSSKCWWYTAYDDGWDGSYKHGHDLRQDAELQEIVRQERALQPLPDWAVRIVQNDIKGLPPCGHYSFPAAYLRVLEAVGAQQSNSFNYTCYTADPARKAEAMDYCLCLDAWLAGAAPESPAFELEALGSLKINWRQACTQLWSALGERTQVKELLVERTLLQMRWWIKNHVWPGDMATRFARDEYLGQYSPTGSFASDNGNRAFPAPAFDLYGSPKVQKIEVQLAALLKDWTWFRGAITSHDYGPHPCAPKAFRSLERLIWAIGKLRPTVKGELIPDFLMASATYVNQDEAAAWWREFLEALRNWWRGLPANGRLATDVAKRLRERTRIKEWLVRLYVRRLEMHEQCGEIRRLLRSRPRQTCGRRPVVR